MQKNTLKKLELLNKGKGLSRHKRKVSFLILFFVVIVLIISSNTISKEKILVIADLDSDKKSEFLLLEKEFTLGYIHSVLLTPAKEYFRVNDENRLVLQKTVYQSFGVGLPFSKEGLEFEMVDDKFILYIERPFEKINMRISPIPNHWLGIGQDRYELIDIVSKEDDLIEIYAEEKWVIKFGKKFIKFF